MEIFPSHRHFFCLYSLKVERNTVNILVDVQFILKALSIFVQLRRLAPLSWSNFRPYGLRVQVPTRPLLFARSVLALAEEGPSQRRVPLKEAAKIRSKQPLS